MRRREVIVGLAAAATWPMSPAAQTGSTAGGRDARQCFPRSWTKRLHAFHEGLAEGGYIEGQNVAIAYRWAEGHYERLPALAAELVESKVAVIAVLGNTTSAMAAKAATATIPIVFRVAADPVELGFVRASTSPAGTYRGLRPSAPRRGRNSSSCSTSSFRGAPPWRVDQPQQLGPLRYPVALADGGGAQLDSSSHLLSASADDSSIPPSAD